MLYYEHMNFCSVTPQCRCICGFSRLCVYKLLLMAYSLLLLSSDVYRIHDAAQGFRDLFGSHRVLLKLGLHSRLRDALLHTADAPVMHTLLKRPAQTTFTQSGLFHHFTQSIVITSGSEIGEKNGWNSSSPSVTRVSSSRMCRICCKSRKWGIFFVSFRSCWSATDVTAINKMNVQRYIH